MEILYYAFDVLFAPLKSLGALWTIVGISIMISFIFSMLYKVLINQDRMRAMKEELATIKEKMNKARKSNKEKELKALYSKSLSLSNQQMMLTFKPLIVSMVFIFLILPWLSNTYPTVQFAMPFPLPLFGATLGWLGLYILITLPVTFVFRKVLGVD